MIAKWTGVALILLGCSAVGFKMANDHRREIKSLRQLIRTLEFMVCELGFRVTPLPQLCRLAAAECGGSIRTLMLEMAKELDAQISPDAFRCMKAALQHTPGIPERTRICLETLGATLGHFDLEGQLAGLESAKIACCEQLLELENNKDARIRSYQTLGLCTGAALVILLL